ncbi:MAG: glycerol-3-phosphate 1-O-acyltransferase PlsY [Nitrospirae bacterium]|nr:glycerol-3-phosphate 1-O-acyltransferase PlsY [Nitrospirota bacterium]MBI5694761.1 glycerol-3-phosphate 1-O-acyltransferase PlsY [Nitrospirota bacterium]
MLGASVAAAYLLGCIPFGLLIAKLKGVDLRGAGSGNIGATNALRVMGKKEGAATLAGDMLKGVVAVLLARQFAGNDAAYIAAAAVVIGHDFPVFLGFKGGKGVATSFGTMLALQPVVGLICVVVWLVTFFASRISSLGALVSFACLPVSVLILYGGDRLLLAVTVFMTAVAFIKHRPNIARLLKGEESGISHKAA